MQDPAQQPTARPAVAEDQPLLFALFCANRLHDFAALGLPPQQLQPLFSTQFLARQIDYGRRFPAAVDTVLCLADGTPAGRHLVERQAGGYRGIDLAILPEYRNRGIGTWALRQIQDLARAEGVPFHLRVLRSNPAQRLYQRLGFQPVSADEISFEMKWTSREHSTPAEENPLPQELCSAP